MKKTSGRAFGQTSYLARQAQLVRPEAVFFVTIKQPVKNDPAIRFGRLFTVGNRQNVYRLNENILYWHVQKFAECVKVVYGRQTPPGLPFVNGSWLFEAEPLLHPLYAESLFGSQSSDIPASCPDINDRKDSVRHFRHPSFLHILLVRRTFSVFASPEELKTKSRKYRFLQT